MHPVVNLFVIYLCYVHDLHLLLLSRAYFINNLNFIYLYLYIHHFKLFLISDRRKNYYKTNICKQYEFILETVTHA
jgi:hypothetical protein